MTNFIWLNHVVNKLIADPRNAIFYNLSIVLEQHSRMSEVVFRTNRPHRGASRYGRNYWCIKTDLSSDGEIFAIADQLNVTSAGALVASTSQAQAIGLSWPPVRGRRPMLPRASMVRQLQSSIGKARSDSDAAPPRAGSMAML